ncbi:winged helix-turn-helix transcriptional regulator [Streptomyces sp. NPDC057582]|uniref:winged helix-turn-helix transcriptional regulator n=1 Tax=Streptomyces sp. NPDC057582 TaxID=3346174 RepID=UPI0036C75ABE
MEYIDQDPSNCSVGRSLEILAQPWVLLILREILRGVDRFSDIQRRLGVSRSVLADRLDLLVAKGVLAKVPYQESAQRRHYSYALTEMGKDAMPVLTALRQWGDKYFADPEGPAVITEHAGCGHPVSLAYVCDAGHRLSGPDETLRRPGPSARPLTLAS